MKNSNSLIQLIVCFCITFATCNASTTDFIVFDATLYKNKPRLESCGVKHLKVIYEREIFLTKDRSEFPSREKIRSLANKYKNYSWIVFDIERWDHNEYNIIKNIDLYIRFIDEFKEHNGRTKIGYYGVLPIRDYWRASKKKGEKKYAQWVGENKKLLELAERVDAIFPSIYTFYKDMKGWQAYAKEQIQMAKMLSSNKPVYPFIWPDYHESNMFRSHDYIGNDYWKLQLETARKYADGIVIWGGWAYGKGRPQVWEENMEWWNTTQEFINNEKCHE